jgi:hypothetical protein
MNRDKILLIYYYYLAFSTGYDPQEVTETTEAFLAVQRMFSIFS